MYIAVSNTYITNFFLAVYVSNINIILYIFSTTIKYFEIYSWLILISDAISSYFSTIAVSRFCEKKTQLCLCKTIALFYQLNMNYILSKKKSLYLNANIVAMFILCKTILILIFINLYLSTSIIRTTDYTYINVRLIYALWNYNNKLVKILLSLSL